MTTTCTDPEHANIKDFVVRSDRLADMFEYQRKLQLLLGNDATTMAPEQLMDYIRTMGWACSDELHEAVNECGWKPWATSNHINYEAFRDELTDAWLFLLNLMIAANMTPGDLFDRWIKKRLNAERRHYEQYDGVSSKCPKCKRAYDNDAVKCEPEIPTGADGKGRPAICAEDTMIMESTINQIMQECPKCQAKYGADGTKCVAPTRTGFGWCHTARMAILGVDTIKHA